MHDPAEVASRRASLVARFGPRLLLGLGSSHAPLVESTLRVPYARPYSKMVEYLDALDEAEAPVPAEMRMLAALGPRMLSLARTRAAAAHPYLVPPEHTAAAARRSASASRSPRSRPWCSAPIRSSAARRPGRS